MSGVLGPALLAAGTFVLAPSEPVARPTAALAAPSRQNGGPYLTVKGRKLFYRISGSGPDLLLLHGGLGSSDDFEKIVPILSRTFRVIAYDRSGHGRSPDSGEPFRYDAMAEEAEAFLEGLGVTSTAVLGWSDGGVIGYHLASRHPRLVTKLVAIGANTRVDGMAAETVEWLRSRSTGASLLADLPEVAARYRRLSPNPGRLESFLLRSRDLWLRDPYLAPESLRRIEAPVLLVAGDRKDIRVEHLLEIRARLKGARLCVIPGASHFVLSEKPHLLMPIVLDFLAS